MATCSHEAKQLLSMFRSVPFRSLAGATLSPAPTPSPASRLTCGLFACTVVSRVVPPQCSTALRVACLLSPVARLLSLRLMSNPWRIFPANTARNCFICLLAETRLKCPHKKTYEVSVLNVVKVNFCSPANRIAAGLAFSMHSRWYFDFNTMSVNRKQTSNIKYL